MGRVVYPKRICNIVVSLVLLGVALHWLDWNSLQHAVLDLSPWKFSVAVGVSFCQFIIMSLRWHQLIRKRVLLAPIEHTKHYFYSVFLNTFTPANLGGDLYRLLALDARRAGTSSVMAVLIQERLLGLMAFFLFYLVSLVGLWATRPGQLSGEGWLFVVVGGIVLLGFISLLILPLILRRLATEAANRWHGCMATILHNLCAASRFDSLAGFIKPAGLSVLAVSIWVLTVQIIALDLHLQVSWFTLGMVAVLVELVRLLPVSIQGIGVREGAYAYLFGVVGASSEAGFVVGTISYLALSLSILMAGAVGFGCLIAARQQRYACTGRDTRVPSGPSICWSTSSLPPGRDQRRSEAGHGRLQP